MTEDLAAHATRRGVLRAAAAASGGTIAAGLLAACGAGNTGGSPGGEEQAQRPAGTVEASQVPVGGGLVLSEPPVVITQPAAGEFHAFSSICTHQGCPVTRVERRGIMCPCHSSFFDPATGQPMGGPAQEPLAELHVTVSGSTVSYS